MVGSFPDERSALMLVCARVRYVTSNEWSTRRYLDMSRLGETVREANRSSPQGRAKTKVRKISGTTPAQALPGHHRRCREIPPSSPAHPRQNAVAGRACDRKGSKHHARRIHHSEPRAGARTRRLGCRGHEDPRPHPLHQRRKPGRRQGPRGHGGQRVGPLPQGKPLHQHGEVRGIGDIDGRRGPRRDSSHLDDGNRPHLPTAPTCYAT